MLLIELLEKSYGHAIWDIQDCPTLRIAFAIFLMERLNQFEEANQQFTIAAKCKPNFDEEFVIFRFQRMI